MSTLGLVVVAAVLTAVHSTQYYTAATVEYAPIIPTTLKMNRTQAVQLMKTNLDQYDILMAEAKQKGAQIIVFPEDGLYSPDFKTRDSMLPFLEPIPDTRMNPCLEPNDDIITLSHASCLARKHKIVLVINMGDVVKSDRSPDGRFQYNTQVAFDEDGYLLQKYHKSHLYYEHQFDAGESIPKTFEAFGIKFGMMICFDIIFDTPSKQYVLDGVTDIVFSSWWVNFAPIINAIQMQQAFSLANKINFIASNPGLGAGASGSGIYSRGKALQTFYNPTNTPISKVLVSNVTRIQPEERRPSGNVNREGSKPPVVSFTSFVPQAQRDYVFDQYAGSLKCQIKCSVRNATDDVYAAFALNGYGFPLFPQAMCGLFKCGKTINDCERILHQLFDKNISPANTMFDAFEIRMGGDIKGNSMFPLVFGARDELFSNEFGGKVRSEWSKCGEYYYLDGRDSSQVLHSAILFSLWH
jgi:predicted amidohydrolase